MRTTFPKLLTAAGAAHVADQLMLAVIPLALTAAGASAATVSAAVAAQSAAWLIVSLPAGALADRLSRRTLMTVGAVLIIIGALVGWRASAGVVPSAVGLGVGGFLMSAGVVLEVLSVFALLPRLVSGHAIAEANARLEFVRAAAALGSPLLAATLVTAGQAPIVCLIAAVAGVVSLAGVRLLPPDTVTAPAAGAGMRPGLAAAIRDGTRFVAREPILRAIALCAVAWNAAFFAMTAILAPYAVQHLAADLGSIGQAWAVYGFGLMAGAALAPTVLRRLTTGPLFLFGPATSFGGALLLALAGHPTADAIRGIALPAALFLMGFGPMLWLVLQTSVRQILTPPDMLGRVAATITTAIYGVRPLGALAAGAVAATAGLDTAMWLVVVLFGLSVVAMIASPAPRLRRLPDGPAAVS